MDKYSPDKEFIVMNRQQVRAFDAWAINILGIPGAVLMENAGRSCAELITEKIAGIKMPKIAFSAAREITEAMDMSSPGTF